ncbi:unnamed protein product [Penicillium palitans]
MGKFYYQSDPSRLTDQAPYIRSAWRICGLVGSLADMLEVSKNDEYEHGPRLVLFGRGGYRIFVLNPGECGNVP